MPLLRSFFASALMLGSITLFSAEGIIQAWDFEGDQPFAKLAIEGEPPQQVADPLVPSNRVMRAELKPTSKRQERSEVRYGKIPVNSERWVGFRTLCQEDPQAPLFSVFQLGPISGGSPKGRGLYQLASTLKSGTATWRIRGYLERVDQPGLRLDTGRIELGRWHTWIMHVNLRADAQGLLEVWHNGKLICQRSGPNALAGDSIPLKWGPYIGIGNTVTAPIVLFYDDVILGDERCRMEDIAALLAQKTAKQ